MPDSKPVEMLVTYESKKGSEEAMQALVLKHWPALSELGLVTNEAAQIWKATNIRTGAVSFVERFAWKEEGASDIAHQSPEIMAIWEPMGPLLEQLTLQRVETIS